MEGAIVKKGEKKLPNGLDNTVVQNQAKESEKSIFQRNDSDLPGRCNILREM